MKRFFAAAALVVLTAPLALAVPFVNNVNGYYVTAFAVENDPGTTLTITPTPVGGAITPIPQSATFAETGFTNSGGAFEVNQHRFTLSSDGGQNPAVYNFQHGNIGIDMSVDIKLTWDGPNVPRKEAGIIFRAPQGNGQFIVNSEREVAAFGNPFEFHNFANTTENIYYDEGDVLNLRIIYTPPVYDLDGVTVLARGNIAYQVRENGGAPVTFGPILINNTEKGFFDNTTIDFYQQARGAEGSTTDGATTVFSNLKFRAQPLAADLDLDGDVDGGDFLLWQRGLGTTMGATKTTGDADGNEITNAADLALWKTQFGMTLPLAGAAAAAVPEPTAASLAALSLVGLAALGRRQA